MNPNFMHNHKTIFVGRPRCMRLIRSFFTFNFQCEIKKVEVCGFSNASVERYIMKQFVGNNHDNGFLVEDMNSNQATTESNAGDIQQYVNIENRNNTSTNNVEQKNVNNEFQQFFNTEIKTNHNSNVKDGNNRQRFVEKPAVQNKGRDILFKIRSSPITDGLSRIPFHAWVGSSTSFMYFP